MGIFDSLSDIFMDNPADSADEYLKQIPGMVKPYYEPYINAGKGTLDDLLKQYSGLMENPGSILSQLGKGYTQSPGYEFSRNQGLQGINNAAAAGGMLGTAGHQQQAGELSTNLANQDFQQYLSKALGLWGTGLQGKEHINDMGFDASTGIAGILGQNQMSRGNFAYEGQAGRNKFWSDLIGQGIGAAYGNPGAAAGKSGIPSS